MTLYFALDVGNKQSKLKSVKDSYVLPSVLINQRDTKSMFSVGTPVGVIDAQLNGDEQEYYIGNGVLNYSQNKLLDSLGFSDRYSRPVYKLLNEFCLGMLGKDFKPEELNDVKVVVGLPTGDYTKAIIDEVKAIFLENKNGNFKPKTHLVTVDGKEVLTKVTDVVALPQPIGTFYNEVLNNDGSVNRGDLVNKRVAIVDVGGGTALLDQLNNVQLDASYRTQLETGANTLYLQIRNAIMQAHGINADLHRIETMIRQGLEQNSLHNTKFAYKQSDNNIFDVTNIVVSEVQHYTDTLVNNVFTTFQNLNEVDNIIVTGGSASIIDQPRFANAFSNMTKVIFTNNPEMANVTGFYKYALLHAKK